MRDANHDALEVIEHLHVLGQREIGDPEVVVDPQIADVDLDFVRNGVRQALHMKIADLKVEEPAFLDTDGRPGDDHGNRYANRLVHHHADEVDVHHLSADRIDLNVLDHGVTLLIGSRHLQEEHGTHAMLTSLDQICDRFAVDGDGHRIAMAAVDHARHLPLLTEFSHQALSNPLPA